MAEEPENPETELDPEAESAEQAPPAEEAAGTDEPVAEDQGEQPAAAADDPGEQPAAEIASEGESAPAEEEMSLEDQMLAQMAVEEAAAEQNKVTPDEIREPEMNHSAVSDSSPVAQAVEFPSLDEPASAGEPRNLDLLMDVMLPVSIELGRTTMPIGDILALGSGSVVELDKLAGEPVDLLVNNKIIALGEVVVIDENFGIRITSLISPEDRVKSL